MVRYTEEHLQSAILEVKSGISQHEAARRWNIPRATLLARLKGSDSRQAVSQVKQRLSPSEEKKICDWIRIQDGLGLAPTHVEIRDFVIRVLRRNGDRLPLGKTWMEGFFKRNPSARSHRSQALHDTWAKGI